MSTVNGKMTIADVITMKPEAVQILREKGMHCIGCAVSTSETLEQAAEVHGIKLQELLDALNA